MKFFLLIMMFLYITRCQSTGVDIATNQDDIHLSKEAVEAGNKLSGLLLPGPVILDETNKPTQSPTAASQSEHVIDELVSEKVGTSTKSAVSDQVVNAGENSLQLDPPDLGHGVLTDNNNADVGNEDKTSTQSPEQSDVTASLDKPQNVNNLPLLDLDQYLLKTPAQIETVIKEKSTIPSTTVSGEANAQDHKILITNSENKEAVKENSDEPKGLLSTSKTEVSKEAIETGNKLSGLLLPGPVILDVNANKSTQSPTAASQTEHVKDKVVSENVETSTKSVISDQVGNADEKPLQLIPPETTADLGHGLLLDNVNVTTSSDKPDKSTDVKTLQLLDLDQFLLKTPAKVDAVLAEKSTVPSVTKSGETTNSNYRIDEKILTTNSENKEAGKENSDKLKGLLSGTKIVETSTEKDVKIITEPPNRMPALTLVNTLFDESKAVDTQIENEQANIVPENNNVKVDSNGTTTTLPSLHKDKDLIIDSVPVDNNGNMDISKTDNINEHSKNVELINPAVESPKLINGSKDNKQEGTEYTDDLEDSNKDLEILKSTVETPNLVDQVNENEGNDDNSIVDDDKVSENTESTVIPQKLFTDSKEDDNYEYTGTNYDYPDDFKLYPNDDDDEGDDINDDDEDYESILDLDDIAVEEDDDDDDDDEYKYDDSYENEPFKDMIHLGEKDDVIPDKVVNPSKMINGDDDDDDEDMDKEDFKGEKDEEDDNNDDDKNEEEEEEQIWEEKEDLDKAEDKDDSTNEGVDEVNDGINPKIPIVKNKKVLGRKKPLTRISSDERHYMDMEDEVRTAYSYGWVLLLVVIIVTLVFVVYMNRSKVQKYFQNKEPRRRKRGDEEKNLLDYEDE